MKLDITSAAKAGLEEIASTSNRAIGVALSSLCFGPGEASQFDWNEDFAVLGGEHPLFNIAAPDRLAILAGAGIAR